MVQSGVEDLADSAYIQQVSVVDHDPANILLLSLKINIHTTEFV